ncbi:vacuolar protein sorting 53 [Dimargaris cristalligena]|uniref:Vacuolar protein sorting 53 n=1 Tax=Dimargaris cristalligena TaxID=215637 RepID=A0A4P9ZVU6_9FUNG|nr:vacuolar protein sorting 53 [Dimargaris cristalligena]|eukprot:RKP36770.1 vacuolar protein sorting 53 [Dimargaris cristalligena]
MASPPGSSALDSEHFPTVDCVNTLFPNEMALWGLDTVSDNIKAHIDQTDSQIQQVMRTQVDTEQQSIQEVQRTQLSIQELYRLISEMKQRAELSQGTVLNITQDIKSLDNAKRNLIAAITVLKRMHMLSTATDQLRIICDNGHYKEASHLLLAVQELQEYFVSYNRIPEVVTLSRRIDTLKRNLAQRIRQDFEVAFNDQGVCTGDKAQLKDACEIMDLLASPEKDRIRSTYCANQLLPYSAIFQPSDEMASLENVSRRYAWLRRVLRTHDEEHAAIFPASWHMGELMCHQFAELTRKQLTDQIVASGKDLDVPSLLRAMQLTLSFEKQLERRFQVPANPATGDPSTFEADSTPESPRSSFARCISSCFEPYLHLYIESEETKINALIDNFKAKSIHSEEDSSISVLSSSTDLLYFYRESLARCSSFSTGQPLLDLVQVFARGLHLYTSEILMGKLPKLYTVDERRPMSHDELTQVCLIINTADYCLSSTAQLEKKLVATIDPAMRDHIQLGPQRDAFFNTIHASIKSLIRGIESCCESAFSAMLKIPWGTLESVGDQSDYVTMVIATLRLCVGVIRRSLTNGRYIRTFCDKFVESFTGKYLTTLQRCRQISEVGAEQMLLDIQATKTILLEMPSMGMDNPPPPPSLFVKLVNKGVSRIEAILKAILAPQEPISAMVDNFLLLFPDATLGGFQVVLDLKASHLFILWLFDPPFTKII